MLPDEAALRLAEVIAARLPDVEPASALAWLLSVLFGGDRQVGRRPNAGPASLSAPSPSSPIWVYLAPWISK